MPSSHGPEYWSIKRFVGFVYFFEQFTAFEHKKTETKIYELNMQLKFIETIQGH